MIRTLKILALAIGLAVLSCRADTSIGGGRRDVPAQAPLALPSTSAVETIDQAGLLNAIAKLDAKLESIVTAQVGIGNESTNVGGNVILDSWVSIACVAGIVLLSLGLALIYRRSANRSTGVAGWLIHQLEARRDRKPCNCGQCADCIVESIRSSCAKGHPLAKTLQTLVKKET